MRILILTISCLGVAASVFAVGTSHWTHTSEADFKAGSFKNVVATNLGDLKLSRGVSVILAEDARISAVYALAQLEDGTIYAATGPGGLLLRVRGREVTTAAELGENTSLVSLLVEPDGGLLVGTAGETGQIFRLAPGREQPESIFSADDVQYVWDLARTSDGMLYAATGPNGQLYQINPDGSHKVLLDTNENNLMCLVSDEGDYLYVGSDPNGLVYRVDRRSGEMFVLYDAPESEISALVRDSRGNLFAATAQATEEEIANLEHAAAQVGRPEAQPLGSPIPSERPPAPEPPEIPDPAPGDPLPIPRSIDPGGSHSGRGHSAEPDADAPVTPDAPDKSDEPDADSDVPAEDQHDLAAASRVAAQAVGVVSGEPAPGGNAIYRIDRDGFVTEVFRQPVVIYSMIQTGGSLLVGTGTGGEVWQIDPTTEETSVLAKVDPRDVLSLLPAPDGTILLGLANSGEIASMTSGFASEGTYTSPVLDAGQISRFGKIRLRGSLPQGTSLRVSTRTSNVAGAADPGWSGWSDEISAAEFVQIPSPPARFLQYRLHFGTGNASHTPVVESVDVAYRLPNLPPRISSITVTPGEPSAQTAQANPDTHRFTIEWEASDPNDDVLLYSLYFRSGSGDSWILLKDRLRETSYEWETRTVADGVYQVKVEASDAMANALGTGRTSSRVSDPVLVDNTAPAIGDLAHKVEGRSVTIEMKAVDRTGIIASAAYAVNSSTDWQTVLPSDSIADSPEEAYRFTVPNLPAGSHQIMLRVLDRRGNAAFESVSVTIQR